MDTICEKSCTYCQDKECPQRRAPIVGSLLVSEDSTALQEGLDAGNFDCRLQPDEIIQEDSKA